MPGAQPSYPQAAAYAAPGAHPGAQVVGNYNGQPIYGGQPVYAAQPVYSPPNAYGGGYQAGAVQEWAGPTGPQTVALPSETGYPKSNPAHGAAYGGSGSGGPGHHGHVPTATVILPAATDKPVYRQSCNDMFWALLFWLHVGAIVAVALTFGRKAITADAGAADDANTSGGLNTSVLIRVLALAVAVAFAASALFFLILQRAAGGLIKCGLYTGLVFQAAFTVAAFFLNIFLGIVSALFLALSIFYVWSVQSRIPFAAAHVEVSCAATRAFPSIFFTSLFMLAIQAAWVLTWSVASLGVQHQLDASGQSVPTNYSSGSRGGTIALFLMLISLYWGSMTFASVSEYIVAATVGHWWFDVNPKSVVRGSLYRAFVPSFGSLALGAFLVSVIRAARVMVRMAQRRAGERGEGALYILLCLVSCVLGCIEAIADYINSWATVYLALTGGSFLQAGKDVRTLFNNRGWTAVINDDLTGNALSIASLGIGALSAVAGGGVAYVLLGSNPDRKTIAAIAAALSFFVGMGMASIITSVLGTAVRTVFVCFALNPAALATTHPEHLTNLVHAWQQFHPDAFAQCGYSRVYVTHA